MESESVPSPETPLLGGEKSGASTKKTFSKYDFKCSKFCFQKCQCDIRLSQDFEPVAETNSSKCTEVAGCSKNNSEPIATPDTSQCQEISIQPNLLPPAEKVTEVECEGNSELQTSFDEKSSCEFDLFDEAIASSGAIPLSSIGVRVFETGSSDMTDCEKFIKATQESPTSNSLYGDLEDDNRPSTSKGRGKCKQVHKHNLLCGLHPSAFSTRGLEGLAIVSTGTMSLTAHLVDIMPLWTNLKKFALIHTGRKEIIHHVYGKFLV